MNYTILFERGNAELDENKFYQTRKSLLSEVSEQYESAGFTIGQGCLKDPFLIELVLRERINRVGLMSVSILYHLNNELLTLIY